MNRMLTRQCAFALLVVLLAIAVWLWWKRQKSPTHASSLPPWCDGKWDRGVIEGNDLIDLSNGNTIKIEGDNETFRTVDKPELCASFFDGNMHWSNGVVWTRRDDHFSEVVLWELDITGAPEDGKAFDIERTDWGDTIEADHLSAAVQVEQVRCGCLIWSGRVKVIQSRDDRRHIVGERANHPSVGQFLVGDTLNVLSHSESCCIL